MKYKFNIGEKVRIKGTEDKGEILDRRFALVSFMHASILPTTYYAVMLQEEYDLGQGPRTLNWAKVEFPQKDLERLASTN